MSALWVRTPGGIAESQDTRFPPSEACWTAFHNREPMQLPNLRRARCAAFRLGPLAPSPLGAAHTPQTLLPVRAHTTH